MWSSLLGVVLSSPAHATCSTYIVYPYDSRHTSCHEERNVKLTPPAVYNTCGGKPKLGGAVTSINGTATYIGLVKNSVTVPIGEHVVTWTLTDKWGNVIDVEYQNLFLEPAMAGMSIMEFNDRAHTHALVASYGTTEIGVDAYTGTILSVGDVWLRERAAVYGDLLTGGIVDKQNDTFVEGDELSGLASVGLPWLADSWGDPPGTVDVVVNAGATLVLAPGAYGAVTVNSTGKLVLKSGDYSFTTFIVDTDAKLESAVTTVYLSGDFIFRGTQPTSTAIPIILTGAGLASVETDFIGVIEALYGTVEFASGGHTYTGRFRGNDVMFGEDSWVECDEVCEY